MPTVNNVPVSTDDALARTAMAVEFASLRMDLINGLTESWPEGLTASMEAIGDVVVAAGGMPMRPSDAMIAAWMMARSTEGTDQACPLDVQEWMLRFFWMFYALELQSDGS